VLNFADVGVMINQYNEYSKRGTQEKKELGNGLEIDI
jgi:hypothetical protein